MSAGKSESFVILEDLSNVSIVNSPTTTFNHQSAVWYIHRSNNGLTPSYQHVFFVCLKVSFLYTLCSAPPIHSYKVMAQIDIRKVMVYL